jgi:hypothetical protein
MKTTEKKIGFDQNRSLYIKKQLKDEWGWKNLSVREDGSWICIKVLADKPETPADCVCEENRRCYKCRDQENAIQRKITEKVLNLPVEFSTYYSDSSYDGRASTCLMVEVEYN